MLEEELRRAALDSLGDHGDERARDVLLHARMVVSASREAWYRVTLGVDAGTLGMIHAAPAVKDALAAAVAAALGARREVLEDLELRWDTAPRPRPVGYRDAPPGEGETLGEAIVAWLDASGEHALARAMTRATASRVAQHDVVVNLDASARALVDGPHALATITSAVRDLFGDAGTHVRLRM
jgi:hypothetical protein